MFTDYSFYQNTYSGTIISEEDFVTFEKRAGEYVNYITYNRAIMAVEPNLTAIKYAVCSVAETLQIQDSLKKDEEGNSIPGPIRNEKVAGHSVGYATIAAGRKETQSIQRAELYGSARLYLAHTGLLYGGVPVI